MSKPPKDPPAVTGATDARFAQKYEALREAVQRLIGTRGDEDDRALTVGDLKRLIATGSLGPGGGGGIPAPPGPIGPPGPPGAGGEEPDLTPPPTPTGLEVTPTFSNLIIEWDNPTYTQGHGHGQTNIYGVTYGGSGPLPTYSNAVLLGNATGARTIYTHPTALGTRWHIWITWQSKDGVESAVAGGTNGFQATTGLVGTSDLGNAIVLAGNLAPGSVTADAADFSIGGSNLIANNSFEVDVDGDDLADGWAIYSSSPVAIGSRPAGRISGKCARIAWSGTNSGVKGVQVVGGAPGVRGGWQPTLTYCVSFYARANTAKAVGCELRWQTAPATTTVLKNPNLLTTWQRYAWRITWGASVQNQGQVFLSVLNAAAITGYIEIDDVQVEEGDTLTGYQGKIAVNTIVAGDGAIGNLAITNALIGNLAVDDAKIAELSASKLTVGDGTIGGNLKSANYVNNTSGWIIRPDGFAQFGFASIRGNLLAGQIGANYITTNMLAADSVTAAKISVTALSAITSDIGTITAGVIRNAANTTRLDLNATGTSPVFRIGSVFSILANGSATFAGTLNGADGTFSGTLTADAVDAVNTINIAGEALIVPRFVLVTTAASFDFTEDIYLTAPSINVGATGTVLLMIDFPVPLAYQDDGSDPVLRTYYNCTVRIKRNGTTIRTWTLLGQAAHPLVPGESLERDVPGQLTDVPGAGNHVYTITLDSASGSSSVGRRSMLLLGVKK